MKYLKKYKLFESNIEDKYDELSKLLQSEIFDDMNIDFSGEQYPKHGLEYWKLYPSYKGSLQLEVCNLKVKDCAKIIKKLEDMKMVINSILDIDYNLMLGLNGDKYEIEIIII